MIDDEQDEVTFEKILEAAKEIKDMARVRPAEAPAMLEQARHLVEIAQQIKSDLLRRQTLELPLSPPYPVPDKSAAQSTVANTEVSQPTKTEHCLWLETPTR